MSSLSIVLLLLVLGSLILAGLNQQLDSFTRIVGDERRMLQQQAATQSALEWGRQAPWQAQAQAQCKITQRVRVCLRPTGEGNVLLIAGGGQLTLWRAGEWVDGQLRFARHGWSDFCPLKEAALCQMP